MSRLPIISSKDMAKLLIGLDFIEKRQQGSHKIFKHADGRTAVVPFHGEDLGRGLIHKILKEIEISVDEYISLRNKL